MTGSLALLGAAGLGAGPPETEQVGTEEGPPEVRRRGEGTASGLPPSVSGFSLEGPFPGHFWKSDSFPWEAARFFLRSCLRKPPLLEEGPAASSLSGVKSCRTETGLQGQRAGCGAGQPQAPEGGGTRPGAEGQRGHGMQVSFACSEHGLKGRGPDERPGRPAASSPSLGSRGRFRAVAMVARSLGQLSVQSHSSTHDASVKQPGMNYR